MSVVIPCYCCAGTIERAIDSVLAQTCVPAEVWLVDDASPDRGATRQALHRQMRRSTSDTRIHAIELKKNVGPSAARNAGWNSASGSLVAFLDADDAWHPLKLQLQTAWMQVNPQVAVCGHLQPVFDQFGDQTLPDEWQIGPVTPGELLRSNRLTTSSVMLRRDLPYRFTPQFYRCEDHLLWTQIALDGLAVYRIELPLAWMYKAPLGEEGLSADRWSMRGGELNMYWRLYREGRIRPLTLSGLIPLSIAKHAWSLVRGMLPAAAGRNTPQPCADAESFTT